jgi:TusE/DsrC/DsvC family sulfur relay protein
MGESDGAKPLAGHPNRKFRIIAGRKIQIDGKGFLRNPEDWSEEVAYCLAEESGLQKMSETHWRVIRFMRSYYFNYGRAPLNRDLKAGTGMSLMELESLFPEGIRQGARRVAGLPNPKSCAG